ncbi:hypothetical protein ACE6H2_020709 [Prunus campanulata]
MNQSQLFMEMTLAAFCFRKFRAQKEDNGSILDHLPLYGILFILPFSPNDNNDFKSLIDAQIQNEDKEGKKLTHGRLQQPKPSKAHDKKDIRNCLQMTRRYTAVSTPPNNHLHFDVTQHIVSVYRENKILKAKFCVMGCSGTRVVSGVEHNSVRGYCPYGRNTGRGLCASPSDTSVLMPFRDP